MGLVKLFKGHSLIFNSRLRLGTVAIARYNSRYYFLIYIFGDYNRMWEALGKSG
jgi:hypothetical protein